VTGSSKGRAAVGPVVVLTTVPDEETGARIAKALVSERLAGCGTILSAARSIYVWKGAVEDSREHLLLLKSFRARYADLEARVKSLHPYETPEILCVPVEAGFEPYLEWLEAGTDARISTSPPSR
jgi:periplasmic divalent cation tolerance protein